MFDKKCIEGRAALEQHSTTADLSTDPEERLILGPLRLQRPACEVASHHPCTWFAPSTLGDYRGEVDDLLTAIERFYDGVPRVSCRAEVIGPFTLFVNPGPGWDYYARPTLGEKVFSVADVNQVRERQRALRVPEAFEWVAETTPGVRASAEATGLHVREHPLLVLGPADRSRVQAPSRVTLRPVIPEDDLVLLGSVAAIAYSAPGTTVGPQGLQELMAAAAADQRTAEAIAFERERLRAGSTIMAAAYMDGRPVAIGSHLPIGGVSEIVAVATLPAYRRRGIAAALTDVLIQDAVERGVETVFLSAADAVVARIYGRLGFRRVATACIGESPNEQALD